MGKLWRIIRNREIDPPLHFFLYSLVLLSVFAAIFQALASVHSADGFISAQGVPTLYTIFLLLGTLFTYFAVLVFVLALILLRKHYYWQLPLWCFTREEHEAIHREGILSTVQLHDLENLHGPDIWHGTIQFTSLDQSSNLQESQPVPALEFPTREAAVADNVEV